MYGQDNVQDAMKMIDWIATRCHGLNVCRSGCVSLVLALAIFIQPSAQASAKPAAGPEDGRPAAGRRSIASVQGSEASQVGALTAPMLPAVRPQFELQMQKAKARIRYLAFEYMKTNQLSLQVVRGPYGGRAVSSPDLFDWSKILNALIDSGHIKLVSQTPNDAEFVVERPAAEWN